MQPVTQLLSFVVSIAMDGVCERCLLGREVVLAELLGSGANGSVFLARPVCTTGTASAFQYPQRFVVKVMRRGILPADGAAMILKEIDAIRSLNHPFIVRYVGAWVESGVGEHCGSVCLAMAHCDGGDLHGLIREYSLREEFVPNELAMMIMLQILSALNHSHAQHIIHRDIKPANLLLVRNDNKEGSVSKALVGDYGLARPLQQTTELAQTRVGTPCYCSPEIVAGEAYSSKTDIFSAGATFFELLTRQRAFWKKHYTEQQSFHAILNMDPMPCLRQIARGRYETCLVRAVEACLCKNERGRPTAYDLLVGFASRLTSYVREKGIPVCREAPKVSPLRAIMESPIRRISPVTPVRRPQLRPDSGSPKHNVSPKCRQSLRATPATPRVAAASVDSEKLGSNLLEQLLQVAEKGVGDKAWVAKLRQLLDGDLETLLLVHVLIAKRRHDKELLENGLFKVLLSLKPHVDVEQVVSWVSQKIVK